MKSTPQTVRAWLKQIRSRRLAFGANFAYVPSLVRPCLILVLVSGFLAVSGCAAYRSHGVFVTGYRLQQLPSDWRQAPLALFQIPESAPELSIGKGTVSSTQEDGPVEDALRRAGFLGGRITEPTGLVVLWRVSRQVLPESPRVPPEAGIPVLPPLLPGGPDKPLSDAAVESAREASRPPAEASSGLETFSLEITIVDRRETGIPEVLRGRCVLRASDLRLHEPLAFAAERILKGVPEQGSVRFDEEVGAIGAR